MIEPDGEAEQGLPLRKKQFAENTDLGRGLFTVQAFYVKLSALIRNVCRCSSLPDEIFSQIHLLGNAPL